MVATTPPGDASASSPAGRPSSKHPTARAGEAGGGREAAGTRHPQVGDTGDRVDGEAAGSGSNGESHRDTTPVPARHGDGGGDRETAEPILVRSSTLQAAAAAAALRTPGIRCGAGVRVSGSLIVRQNAVYGAAIRPMPAARGGEREAAHKVSGNPAPHSALSGRGSLLLDGKLLPRVTHG
jgi:hypothetical protein